MRLQLALNVDDLDAAVDFYTTMFGTPPANRHEEHATFAVADPPLKLALFANAGPTGSINHLGVETETAEEVRTADTRLAEAGLATTGVQATECCYAEKTETWVSGPDGTRWEWYVRTGDADHLENTIVERVALETLDVGGASGGCCS